MRLKKTLPNTFLIGAQKSGTTTLHDWIGQHPDVYCIKQLKDFPFFINDEFYKKGLKWFSGFFDDAGKKIVLHSSVQYIYFHNIFIPRMQSFNSNIKMIAIIRNPVERAYSAYWQARKTVRENCDTFEEALNLQDIRAKSNDFDVRCHLTYIDHGFYYGQINNFYRMFDRQQLFIALFDDLKNKPLDLMKKIYTFLGIDNNFQPILRKLNASRYPLIKTLQRFINYIPKATVLPKSLKYFIVKNNLTRARLIELNSKEFKPPALDVSTKKTLLEIYRKDILSLQDLLNRDLSDWLTV
jgi:sulfotransferase family protein